MVVDTSYLDAFVKGHRPPFRLLQSMAIPCLPGGDLLFLLKASPELIVERKPELTIEEISEYYRRIMAFTKISRASTRIVASDNGVDRTTKAVVDEILARLGSLG